MDFHGEQRTTRHAGYRASQRLRKMKVAGLAKVSFLANLIGGCYALLRVARLTASPPLVST